MNLMYLMVWKEFMHIRNDKLSIRLMVFPVLAQLFVMGYALTTEVRNTPVAVFDQSRSPSSRALSSSIRANSLFNYKGEIGSYGNLMSSIEKSMISIALVIPPDFEKKVHSEKGALVQLLIDGQDANSSNVASGYINAIINKWNMTFLSDELQKKGIQIETVIPIKVNSVVLFNPLLKSTWFMVPALVVVLVTMVTSLLSGFSIVREKEAGTLEQLLVTPVNKMQLIFGKTIPYCIIGLIELCVFLLFATLWFRIPFRGNFFVFILFGLIYMLSSLGIGVFTSTIAKTAQQVLMMIWFILIFFILLSGFFIPVENMPLWVQHITVINPVRWFIFAVRQIFLKGATLAALWKEGVIMLCTGVVVFGFAIGIFNNRAQ